MICVRDLTKHRQVHEKEPGFLGSLRSLVNRKHRTVVAVDRVSFEIGAGEVVGFLGPNGLTRRCAPTSPASGRGARRCAHEALSRERGRGCRAKRGG